MPWQKGQSGNPGGYSKAHAEVARLARECAKEVVQRLREIALNSDNQVAAIKAGEVLLERGFGKAIQPEYANSVLDALDTQERENILSAFEDEPGEAGADLGADTAGSC